MNRSQWAAKGGHTMIGHTRALPISVRCLFGRNEAKNKFETLFSGPKPPKNFFLGIFTQPKNS